MSQQHDLDSRLALARDIAVEAGRLTLEYFQRDDLQVDRKRDGSVVTRADREAEVLLRERIESAFPADAILGEEHGTREGSSGYRWILDPIDGTKSFVHGVPLYGTLIGIEHTGSTVAGVIRIPALDESVWAARGGGAWHQQCRRERPARVSETSEARDALLCTTAIDYFTAHGRRDLYLALAAAAGCTRGWSDCYAHVLLATGRVDVVVEPQVNPWDIAAIAAIAREAGGAFTDWAGRDSIDSGNSLISNGRVHEHFLSLLK